MNTLTKLKFYLMKRETLQCKIATCIFTLLLVFLFGLSPFFIKAQPQEYESYNGTLVGTSDTRLMASIYETDNTVTMIVRAVGYMKADNIAFSVFYDPGKLIFCNENLVIQQIGALQNDAAVLAEEFITNQWMFDGLHKAAGTAITLTDHVSGHATMNAILFELGLARVLPEKLFVVNAGEVKNIMQFTFKKVTPNQLLTEQDFGLGVKTTGTVTGFYQPEFGHDGLFIWYRDRNTSIYKEVDPNVFLFRSGLEVKTYLLTPPATTSATIDGTFWQGATNLPVSDNILDNIGTATTGNAKLNHDAITKYGFIYTSANVNITTDEFSGLIKIDGVDYPVPTGDEIRDREFMRNGNTFYITMVDDNNGSQETLSYSATLSNLMPNQAYCAWAYTHYYFETSDTFQAVGNRVTFSTAECVALNIGTIYTLEYPTCNNNNGKIQMLVTEGSGNYVFSVNGGEFTAYANDIITGLTAGTYTIAVKDIIQLSCDSTVVHNVVLHNTGTDLNVTLTATNAATCDGTGALFVAVTGGSGDYSYSLNGTTPTMVNGWITDLPVGEYEMTVTDNHSRCVATNGIAYIYADDSQLEVDIAILTHASCATNSGTIMFTVTGAQDDSFTYQLNGLTAQLVENNNNAEITLSGLSAGIHYLRINDACNEIVREVIITNGGSNTFAFTATAHKEVLSCNGNIIPGSVTLTLTNGISPFEYSINGSNWLPLTDATIQGLHYGLYRVQVRDSSDPVCTYEENNITIGREISFDSNITSPVATTPQIFCDNATVVNLQATGVNIKWYATAEGGYPLSATTALVHDSVYYAAQTVGFCQSQTRTAVKVYIDPFAVLDTPQIATPQHFCGSSATLTLADIVTDGNTNIVWYDMQTGGSALSLIDPLEQETYYAVLVAGNCQTATRLAVEVFIDQTVPLAPEMIEHQYFCGGALIANIAVPNNQIVWYLAETGGTPLAATYPLEDGVTYYAAQNAGDCESATRAPVTVHLDAPEAPEAPTTQFICKKHTLADLTITGSGIVWYDEQTGGDQLQLTEILEAGKTYWAAQSSGNCEGERIGITISNACYTVHGTVFPFVHGWGDADTLFNVTVSLYHVPTTTGDPIDAILESASVKSVTATFYDGSVYIAGTPKYPGAMGSANNPGKKISWERLGKTVINVNDTATTVLPGEVPVNAVGMYTFENVVPGTYILEIYRPGFLTRWGKITINEDGMSLGHREILAGEFTGDYSIRLSDISILNGNLAERDSERYNAIFDVNGTLDVDASDIDILLFNLGAFLNIYLETEEWINGD